LFKKNSTKDEKKVKEVTTESKEKISSTDGPVVKIFFFLFTGSKRVKVEKRKKVKDGVIGDAQDGDKILFGESLETTISAFPCNDGINIPYPIRMCFDIIEGNGIF
jgi:hypothetical protein